MARTAGGLLRLLNWIGGKVIYGLIGEDAWNDADTLNYLRPFLGGIILALPFDALVYYIFFQDRLSFTRGLLLFFLIPILCGVVGLGLEELRKEASK